MNHRRFPLSSFLTLLLCASLAAGSAIFSQAARADEIGDLALKLIEEKKGILVIVTIEGNLTARTTGDELPARPQQRRTLGVTIEENGLVVVSNSAIDPSVGLVGQQARVSADKDPVKILSAKTEYSRVEISYGDGSLLPGTVIRQEVEADLAFILPDEAKAKELGKVIESLNLSEPSAAPNPGDPVIGLSRSSQAYAYMPTVIPGRITGVFQQDRVFYVTTAGTTQGVPVFGMDGKPIGITVERIIEGNRTGLLGTVAASSVQVQAKLALETYKGRSGGGSTGEAPAAPGAESGAN